MTPELTNPDPHDEQTLIASLRAGDERAYEFFFRQNAGAMLAVARRFFGDTDDAADAVQEAFVSAFRSINRFEGASRLSTWLHRITVNACLMRLRGRKRWRTVSLDEQPAARPEADAMARHETAAKVRACIEELPAVYKSIILLRDIEGLSTAEAATRLGTNEGVVKTRLHRARQALKGLLEPHWAEALA